MGMSADDFLEHVGVKGMHWGQRKARPTKGRVSGSKSASSQRLLNAHKKTKMRKVRKSSTTKRGWAYLNKTFAQVQSDKDQQVKDAARAERARVRAIETLKQQQEDQRRRDALSGFLVKAITGER